MRAWNPEANDIFLKALDLRSPEERQAFLDTACGADAGLRGQVDALLAASERAGSFLEAPAPGLPGTVDDPPAAERPGTVIGPYKLLQPIGEGGMGAVYMAEQAHPVQRQVALKVIKAGMDSRQVVARFEAERQALALMDHPNIAKVLDAGTTESGRPYFVMELVKGVPITQFCDARRLTPKERLELFVPVCQAVQHAHQKGVIHRDLKPSNVLVALYDGTPVPKVIDFGVAKATGAKLTERTLFTGFGAVVGTLEYMSPEQAEPNQLDIDTRSDVYSLGVLLYELLTGTTPLGRKRLKEAALLEVLRLIREEEPPRPSARLSTTEELPSIAANRGLEPRRLSGLVRGDLDWIAMKCLEKDRNRRYATANGLALDVQRYLRDEPVLACPPSAAYRLRKLLRRHRALAATLAGAGILVLLAGLSAHRAYRLDEQRRADRHRHEEQLRSEKRQNALDRAMLVAMGGDLKAAEKAVAEAELLGASAGQVRMLRGQVQLHRQEPHEAIGHLEQAAKLLPESVAARSLLAVAYVMNWQRNEYAQTLREVEQLAPVTPEDFLFKGHAESLINPERGLKTLEEVFRRPDSTAAHSIIARAVRAATHTRLALVTGDPAAVERAVEDLVVVKAVMADSPQPLVSSTYAHLVAARLYGEGGHEEKRRAALAQAGRDAKALERFPTVTAAAVWRYNYLDYVGQDDAAFEEVRRLSEHTHHRILVITYAVALYRRGEYQQAADFLARRRWDFGVAHSFDTLRAYVLAELPDGPARALEVYRATATEPHTALEPLPPHTVLLLLGRKAEAVAASLEVRARADRLPATSRDWHQKLLDYDCDLLPADELLKAAARSRLYQIEAHYRVAFHRLADGDRAGAREHFRRCLATNYFMHQTYHWSRAFLARLEQDPAWPHWIPAKK